MQAVAERLKRSDWMDRAAPIWPCLPAWDGLFPRCLNRATMADAPVRHLHNSNTLPEN